VHAVAGPVLAHRFIIRPEAEVEGKTTYDVVRQLLDTVPVMATSPA
jgi:MoxR-like ATPase